MAKSLEQLKQKYADITAKNKEAYDALYSSPSGTGYSPSNSINAAYEKAVKEGKVPANIQAKYDKLSAAYKKTQEAKNALKKELDAAQKVADAEKTKGATLKSAQKAADKALEDLKVAEAKVDSYGGEKAYYDAYNKAKVVVDDLVKAGGKPMVLPPQKIPVPSSGEKLGADGKPVVTPEMTPSQTIDFLVKPENSNTLKTVQQNLAKNFGYTGPIDGKWSPAFSTAFNNAYTVRGGTPETLRGASLLDFIADPGFSVTTSGSGSGTTAQYTPTANISNATQAASAINQVFQNELRRDATKTEIANITKQLNDAQRKNPSKATKNKAGVVEYTGGLDIGQFITDIARTLPEYTTKKETGFTTTLNPILNVAKSNGITPTEEQINSWKTRIKNGETADAIEADIRAVASLGQPDSIKKMLASGTNLDTIYAPYKQRMSAILEIPMDKIDMNDRALRSAIGPDKEMTTYEYDLALRKDPRWEYTQNAKTDVSNAVDKVLRDFGFKG